MISPTELMDGAIISGNCVSACDKNNTYVHLNNPVVKSLYEHHGKDLNFVGVIITNENVTLADKKRSGDSITIVVPKAIGDCELKRIPVTELLPIIAAGRGD